ncbi:protein-export chaperone SecB [Blautia massiliensis (ex Durand et al. 2017)]|uniref:protein-export chaperone SecB n=1 Tax=Blautia massiliensis (ex Durand et al. 2017) TaxID=1737424 RepID=UPI0022E4F35C|nr:protein-export chaperone SecB [Blautia massiliensis (ex Durand et al. 2017)]
MEYESNLILQHLVFDEIEFKRLGFKTESEVNYELEIQIGRDHDNQENYKVTLVLNGKKDKEYIFKIVLSGFFEIKNAENISDKETLIHKNAVAIMMPYLRSEVSLLTSQPETNSIVMPIFNINKMIK